MRIRNRSSDVCSSDLTVAFPDKAADIAFGFRGQAAGGPDKGAALQSLNEHIHARRAAVDTDGFHEAEHRAVVGELEKPAPRVAGKILDGILQIGRAWWRERGWQDV